MTAIGVLLHDFALGGSERVAIRLANAWAQFGCRVILFLGNGNGPQRGLVAANVGIEIAQPCFGRTRNAAGTLGARFGQRCAALGLDVAFIPGNSYFRAVQAVSAAAGQVAVYAKISNVLWRADRSLPGNVLFLLKTRRRLRAARAVVALSPRLALQSRRVLGAGCRIEVLADPVLDSMPAEVDLRRAWHICAAGRLVPQKNFSLLLRSVSMLRDLPVTLEIVGDGPQEDELRRLAASLGIEDRVVMRGRVDDVHPLFAAAEITALTSDFEGYPAVLVEALAAGSFVIARNCSPAIPEIISSPMIGTCVDSGDPAAFATAMRRYFRDRACDRGMMRQVAARHITSVAARRYLELFAGSSQ